MSSEAREHDGGLLWGLTPSLILHALIIALLVYSSSRLPQQNPDDGAVSVVMVPPPEQMKPEPAPQPKEAKVEKTPEPKVEKPIEQKVEKPSPPLSSIEELKPVFQFGAKDSGPRKSLDGSSAQESPSSPAKSEGAKQSDVVKDNENKSAAEPDRPKQEDAASSHEAVQEAEKAETTEPDAEANGADAEKAATDDTGQIELPMAAAAPQPRPAKVAKPKGAGAKKPSSMDVAIASSQGDSSLPGVRRLYSQGATGDPFAGTSMDGVPRDQRAGKLCATALQQRLLDEGYFAGLLPYRLLKTGNVLNVPDATFRTRTAWYRVSFRCEVDAKDTSNNNSYDGRGLMV